MVTRWGVTCGMDNYARELAEAVRDDIEFVVFADAEQGVVDGVGFAVCRDWDVTSHDISAITRDIRSAQIDLLHIQFNWGGMPLAFLLGLVRFALAERLPCVVQLHATYDHPSAGSLGTIATDLGSIAGVIVHGQADIERMASWGLTDNVWLWRLGECAWPQRERSEVRESLGLNDRRPILATFGFLQERKGLLELLAAIGELKESYPSVQMIACAALHPRWLPRDYYLACRMEVARASIGNNVDLLTSYLPQDVAMLLLQSADAIVLPYVGTQEGSSAAAKFCAWAGRPLVLSHEPLFDAFDGAALRLETIAPGSIAEAVHRLVDDPELVRTLSEAALRVASLSSWEVVGPQYVEYVARPTGGRARCP